MISTRAPLLLATLLAATAACAQFELASTDPLGISFAGEPLVQQVWVTPELDETAAIAEAPVAGWDHVLRVWQADEGSRMRQEIALRPDRIEFTHMRLVKPDITGSQVAGFLLPADLLDGVRVEFIGTPKGSATAEGRVFSGTLGEGGVTSIKYLKLLRLHLPAGAIDIDCEPRGLWAGSGGHSKFASRWTIYRADEGWLLVATDGKSRYGKLHDAKLIITPASERPVDDVHPLARTRWTDPYYPSLRVNIGATPVPKYESCSFESGDDWLASWADSTALRLARDERFVDVAPARVEGATPVNPTLPVELRMRVERDGWYLVSLLVGSPERAVGPCEVFAGHGQPRATPVVAAGDYGSWPVIGHAVDGVITVRITGDFRLVAAQAAVMMYANEDYLVERSWWVSEDFHPDDDLPL